MSSFIQSHQGKGPWHAFSGTDLTLPQVTAINRNISSAGYLQFVTLSKSLIQFKFYLCVLFWHGGKFMVGLPLFHLVSCSGTKVE